MSSSTARSEQGEQNRGRKRPYGVLPNTSKLQQMREQGMTYREIAEEVSRLSGVAVTPAAVSVRFRREGLSGPKKRYDDTVPWQVNPIHEGDYRLQCLRLKHRFDAGETLNSDQVERLVSFQRKLDELERVVDYAYDTEEGFYLVPRQADDGDGYVRRPENELN